MLHQHITGIYLVTTPSYVFKAYLSEQLKQVRIFHSPSKATVKASTFLPLVKTVNLLGYSAKPLTRPVPCAVTGILTRRRSANECPFMDQLRHCFRGRSALFLAGYISGARSVLFAAKSERISSSSRHHLARYLPSLSCHVTASLSFSEMNTGKTDTLSLPAARVSYLKSATFMSLCMSIVLNELTFFSLKTKFAPLGKLPKLFLTLFI